MLRDMCLCNRSGSGAKWASLSTNRRSQQRGCRLQVPPQMYELQINAETREPPTMAANAPGRGCPPPTIAAREASSMSPTSSMRMGRRLPSGDKEMASGWMARPTQTRI